ncbi:zf-HC2 domain-containing protein [Micromonospora krabiensis]|nr:zf-HC2 domain-containing protein [Micromonospora krabiensis]
MGCEQWREILSAQLDGEATAAEQVGVEAHLDGCAGCRDWLDRAARVTRRSRLSVLGPAPDLAPAILAALPAPAPARRSRARVVLTLRTLLGLIGALQLVLGLAQVGRSPGAAHSHAGVLASGHLWHESAAWNIAVGAGFLFVAARRTPPTGLVPMLSAFVGMLALLSVNDLLLGRVDLTRLVSHGFLLGGYLVVIALSRRSLWPDDPRAGDRGDRTGWRLRVDEEPEPAPTALRLAPHPGTARAEDRRAA